MDPFDVTAILMTLTAVFAFINYRFIKFPITIGLMFLSILFSIALIIVDSFGVPVFFMAQKFIGSIDFRKILLEGMLGILLFAGALHVNINDLANQKIEIAVFAIIGVACSTLFVGLASFWIIHALGLNIRLIDCFLFGSLIAPTDPIAVLGILKTAGVQKTIETKITGESLFNDGIGVVIFLALLGIASGQETLSISHIAVLFVEEAVGGVLYGFIIGYIAYMFLKRVNQYSVEILITLALVLGGYALAPKIHVSGPIALVVAGLLIGNHGRNFAMSKITREHLDTFWELIDEVLNSLLFVLIGLEVLILTFKGMYIFAGVILIPVVLFARFVSIGIPIGIMARWRIFAPGCISIMTWGGLRGGISVALALSVPEQCSRDLVLTITYVIVAFSIIVQGLTIKKVVEITGKVKDK